MKFSTLIAVGWCTIGARAFVPNQAPFQPPSSSSSLSLTRSDEDSQAATSPLSRRAVFLQTASTAAVAALGSLAIVPQQAEATGRATLEQSFRRYAPRIRAGGEFYETTLKELIIQSDWKGIKEAVQEVPDRKKADLTKPDAGVAARARQAGGFSDARVLVAADLLASAFSNQNSITPKTRAMKDAVEELRTVVAEMEATAKEALGETSGGGFFGLGKKKPNEAELKQKIRSLYAKGGTAWNKFVYQANDNLALQFDRFEYIK